MGTSEFRRRGLVAAQGAIVVVLSLAVVGLGGRTSTAQQPGSGKPAAQAAAPVAPAPPAAKPAAAPAAAKAPPAAPAASKYREEQPDDNLGRTQRVEIDKILRSGSLTSATQSQLDAYYQKYVFPRWTVVASHAVVRSSELPRVQLRNDLTAKAKSGPVYDHLLLLAMRFLKPAAFDPTLHPGVRFNAILAIGELDAGSAGAGLRATVTPYPEGLTTLLEALNDPNQIDGVRLGALQGLVRHATAGIPPQVRDQQVIPLLMQIATSPVPPGRPSEAHTWMRKLAVDALGNLGTPGANGAIAKTLANIAGTQDAATGKIDPFYVRRAAAEALGRLNYQGATGVTPLELAVPVGRILPDAFSEHSRRPAPRPVPTGTAMMGGMPGMTPYGRSGRMPSYPSEDAGSGYGGGFGGPAAFDPDEDRKIQFRRLYKTELGAVLKGLGRLDAKNPKNSTGLAAFAADTPDKNDDAFFEKATAILVREQVNKLLDDDEATFVTLRRSLAQSTMVNFRKLLEDAIPGGGGGGLPKPLPTKPAATPAPAPAPAPATPAAAPSATPPAPAAPAKTP